MAAWFLEWASVPCLAPESLVPSGRGGWKAEKQRSKVKLTMWVSSRVKKDKSNTYCFWKAEEQTGRVGWRASLPATGIFRPQKLRCNKTEWQSQFCRWPQPWYSCYSHPNLPSIVRLMTLSFWIISIGKLIILFNSQINHHHGRWMGLITLYNEPEGQRWSLRTPRSQS